MSILRLLVLSTLLLLPGFAAAKEVNVYSYRQPFLVKPLFDAFTAETGIEVNVLFAKKGMVERLKAEGRNSPADVIMTVDIGRLTKAVAEGVTQSVSSDVINGNVPTHFRDPEGRWFGLTSRARVFFVSKERVKDGELTSYADLAKADWEGRVCTRSGKHAYNIALWSALTQRWGEAEMANWLAAVKENLARKPQGNDRAQVKAIADGLCDVSIGNTYYMGKMLENPKQKRWADAVRIVFPDGGDDQTGTHVNLSGMAMAAHAPNRGEALQLMEFLSSEKAQQIYAATNFEYPVKPGVASSELVQGWGAFKADPLSLTTVAEGRPAALKLVDQVGFDK